MTTFLKSVAEKIAYVACALIILAALLVTISRLLTPVLDGHRLDIEKIASQFLMTPVKIEKVDLSWYKYQPEISLNHVTIIDKKTQQPSLQIEKIRVFFSIFKSLWQRKPVINGLVISGAEIKIRRKASGEFSIQGFPAIGGFSKRPYQTETKFTDALAWLSSQERLILENIDLRYIGFTNQERYVTLYHLGLENAGEKHVVLGKAILHQAVPTEVNTAVQWRGSFADLANIKATIYLYVSGLSTAQWLKGKSFKGWQMQDGVMSAKVWGTWANNRLERVQTALQLYNAVLYSEAKQSTYKINRLSGNLGWRKDGNRDVIAGSDLLIDLPHHLWPITNFHAVLAPNASGTLWPQSINLGYVDLQDVQDFLFASPDLFPQALRAALEKWQLSGSLANTAILLPAEGAPLENASLKSEFTNLHVKAVDAMPGVSHLTGNVKWNGKEGMIKLQSKSFTFTDPNVFNTQIALQQLTGVIDITKNADNWQFVLNQLQLTNQELQAIVNGRFTFAPEQSPYADLEAQFSLKHADHAVAYLPAKIFEPELVEWLNQAFLGGEINHGHAILRGSLNDYPFDKNNGTFAVTGNVSNVDLRYAPDWPKLQHVEASLAFVGRKMMVDVTHAQTLGLNLGKVHAEIPSLGDDGPQFLNVVSEPIQSDFVQGMQFVHQSPLEKTLGKKFEGVELKGPIALQLKLQVPLKKPEDIAVQGDLRMTNATMNLTPWHLSINQLKGDLQFTEKATTAEKIQGLIFNKPLTFSLATTEVKKSSIIRANFNTELTIKEVATWLKLPLSDVADGTTHVQGTIDFSLHEPLTIQVNSDLQGITMTLPLNYGKQATEKKELALTVIANEGDPLKIKLAYANTLGAALLLNQKNEQYQLLSANVRIGQSGVPAWPVGNGLSVDARFDTLDWNALKDQLPAASNNKQSASLKPAVDIKQVDVHAKKIIAGGQTFDNVKLMVEPKGNDWNVDVDSAQLDGVLSLPMAFNAKSTVVADFRHINLSASTGAGKTPVIDVASLPAIRFNAAFVSYNHIPFGRVSFVTSPTAQGLSIDKLHIISPRLDLHASGDWLQSAKGYQTFLHGDANTRQLSELIDSFGVDAKNFVATTGEMTFDLTWHDAPFAPGIDDLSGTASLDIGKGRIVDIGQESKAKMDLGRMLSIFSLQTIPRRLSLDFSDVFQKGYSFDYIRGNYKLQDGTLATNNMEINGPVAKVAIKGNIGMKHKNYNLTLAVTPYVTSSIPIAATLLTGQPLIGLAAFAVNSFISPEVSKVTTYSYSVTGSWDNPVWKTVSKDDK